MAERVLEPGAHGGGGQHGLIQVGLSGKVFELGDPNAGGSPLTGLGGTYVAIDFETATDEHKTACAVGLAKYVDGELVGQTSTLIRPPDNVYADENIAIHGIRPELTENARSFNEVCEWLAPLVENRFVVAHNAEFDVNVLIASAAAAGATIGEFWFGCTFRLAQAMGHKPCKLGHLADEFGLTLDHHNPLSDALAAGDLWRLLPESVDTTIESLLLEHRFRLGHHDGDGYRKFSNREGKRPFVSAENLPRTMRTQSAVDRAVGQDLFGGDQ